MDETRLLQLKNFYRKAVPLFFLFLGMFGSFKFYEYNNRMGIARQNEDFLVECTDNLQRRLDKNIEDYVNSIASISYLYSELVSNMSESGQVLAEIEKKSQFDSLYYVSVFDGRIYSSSGITHDSDGREIDARNTDYFRDAWAGNSGITVLHPSRITGGRSVIFYSPIIQSGMVTGVLLGEVGEESFKKMLATYFYGTLADTLLIDARMRIVGVTSRLSIRDYIGETDDPYDFYSVAKIQLTSAETERQVFEAIRGQKECPFRYSSPLGYSLGYVKKLESVDWMILQTYPADALKAQFDVANRSGKLLELLLICDFTIYIVFIISVNVAQRKKMQKKLNETRSMAVLDELTQLFNRRAFDEDVTEFKGSGWPENLALIEIDINSLKVANDTLGHKAGDELIVGTAQILRLVFFSMGKVYRLGGDEFAVFLSAPREDVVAAVSAFRERVRLWKGQMNEGLSVSVGVAFARDYPDKTMDEIKTLADMLMYQDKAEYYKKIRLGKSDSQEEVMEA